MVLMLYDRPIVPMSDVENAWFDFIKVGFELYMKEIEGPYNLPDFFHGRTHSKHNAMFVNELVMDSLWNPKDHLVRHYCPVEVTIPRFTQVFNGRYYDERIKLMLLNADEKTNYVFGIESANDGAYKLYISDLHIAMILRMAYGYSVINHAKEND